MKLQQISLLIIILISGCATTPQISQEEIDNAECQKLGFKPSTEAFGNCRLKLREIAAQERTAKASEDSADNAEFFGLQNMMRH